MPVCLPCSRHSFSLCSASSIIIIRKTKTQGRRQMIDSKQDRRNTNSEERREGERGGEDSGFSCGSLSMLPPRLRAVLLLLFLQRPQVGFPSSVVTLLTQRVLFFLSPPLVFRRDF